MWWPLYKGKVSESACCYTGILGSQLRWFFWFRTISTPAAAPGWKQTGGNQKTHTSIAGYELICLTEYILVSIATAQPLDSASSKPNNKNRLNIADTLKAQSSITFWTINLFFF